MAKKEPDKLKVTKWKVFVDGQFVGVMREAENLKKRIRLQNLKGIELKPVYS